MVQSRQGDVVAHARQFALRVHQLLGHDEQRYTACAGHQLAGGIGNLCQHQMDDVLCELMLATGNPHLVAFEAVACTQRVGFKSVTVRHCAGCHIAQAGAGLGLTQSLAYRYASPNRLINFEIEIGLTEACTSLRRNLQLDLPLKTFKSSSDGLFFITAKWLIPIFSRKNPDEIYY